MVVAKRTSKNQLTLPKAVVEQAGQADYYDVTFDSGRLQELGIREADVSDAVTWARNE
jgi:hypothetical protein